MFSGEGRIRLNRDERSPHIMQTPDGTVNLSPGLQISNDSITEFIPYRMRFVFLPYRDYISKHVVTFIHYKSRFAVATSSG